METNIYSLSPLDGRYKEKTFDLSLYFSEAALISYRTKIEIEYFNFLLKFLEIDYSDFKNFELKESDLKKVKKIETSTKHDVKAVEIFLREILKEKKYSEYIHFGLTSQDINSSSYVLSMKEANQEIIVPEINKLLLELHKKSFDWKNIPMLAKTHGQPATPTNLGKEMMVFIERIEIQTEKLKNFNYTTKFGGAVGNFHAHYTSYPKYNWFEFGNNFIESLGLKRNQFTTQIDHYDNYSELFDILKRISTILTDFCRDIWLYISNNYFKQKCISSEVGSSTMPHKINPINFENAEGNLMIAVSFFEFMSRKLPISRLQRDLTDSTVLRNIGSCYGYLLVGLRSILSGLERLEINHFIIEKDLEDNKIVLSEAIQTILRREGVSNSYEIIKNATRNKSFDLDEIIVSLKEKDLLTVQLETEIYGLDISKNTWNF